MNCTLLRPKFSAFCKVSHLVKKHFRVSSGEPVNIVSTRSVSWFKRNRSSWQVREVGSIWFSASKSIASMSSTGGRNSKSPGNKGRKDKKPQVDVTSPKAAKGSESHEKKNAKGGKETEKAKVASETHVTHDQGTAVAVKAEEGGNGENIRLDAGAVKRGKMSPSAERVSDAAVKSEGKEQKEDEVKEDGHKPHTDTDTKAEVSPQSKTLKGESEVKSKSADVDEESEQSPATKSKSGSGSSPQRPIKSDPDSSKVSPGKGSVLSGSRDKSPNKQKSSTSSTFEPRKQYYGTRNNVIMQEKEKFLAMTVEEKRKHYKGKTYVTLDDIETWSQFYHVNTKSLKELYPDEYDIETFLKDGQKYEVDEDLNARVSLFEGDITTLEIDGIVNAANSSLLGGGGVDGAIHRAAGSQLVDECRTLAGCSTGDAKTTCGYRLPAKYVIHTVGPQSRLDDKLESCYRRCLEEMKKHEMRSIAFCCVSTGIYGFPNDVAVHIALKRAREFLMEQKEQNKLDTIDRLIFCLFLRVDIELYRSWMQIYFPCAGSKSPKNVDDDFENNTGSPDSPSKGTKGHSKVTTAEPKKSPRAEEGGGSAQIKGLSKLAATVLEQSPKAQKSVSSMEEKDQSQVSTSELKMSPRGEESVSSTGLKDHNTLSISPRAEESINSSEPRTSPKSEESVSSTELSTSEHKISSTMQDSASAMDVEEMGVSEEAMDADDGADHKGVESPDKKSRLEPALASSSSNMEWN